MDTALTKKIPFILDRNFAKANCTGNHVCTSCDRVVLVLITNPSKLRYCLSYICRVYVSFVLCFGRLVCFYVLLLVFILMSRIFEWLFSLKIIILIIDLSNWYLVVNYLTGNKYSRVYILSRVWILSLYDFELNCSAEA